MKNKEHQNLAKRTLKKKIQNHKDLKIISIQPHTKD
jgi:hypothetical protein